MPCNPNIGGSSKGHLVREVDALGGEMGKVIDRTFIQSKMLNRSKGPAVHFAPRAGRQGRLQPGYAAGAGKSGESGHPPDGSDGPADGGRQITGVRTYSGATYHCRAVILCTGTYLKSRCIYGDVSTFTGPNGLQSANYLTDSLKSPGHKDVPLQDRDAGQDRQEFYRFQ